MFFRNDDCYLKNGETNPIYDFPDKQRNFEEFSDITTRIHLEQLYEHFILHMEGDHCCLYMMMIFHAIGFFIFQYYFVELLYIIT